MHVSCLDATREGFHDVGLDAGHEAEVEEDQAAVVLEHDVALVRVGVHEAGEDERGGARLDGHTRHAQPLLGGQRGEVRALDPLGDEDLRGRVLRHGLGRGDEAEEVERRLEGARVLRLTLVRVGVRVRVRVGVGLGLGLGLGLGVGVGLGLGLGLTS